MQIYYSPMGFVCKNSDSKYLISKEFIDYSGKVYPNEWGSIEDAFSIEDGLTARSYFRGLGEVVKVKTKYIKRVTEDRS